HRPVRVGVLGPDASLGQVDAAVPQLRAAHIGAQNPLGLFGRLRLRNLVGGEELFGRRAGGGDDGGAGGADLEDPAGAHAGGGGDGVDVEEDLVVLVGREQIAIRQGTDHTLRQRAGELVALVIAEEAREDLQYVPHPR